MRKSTLMMFVLLLAGATLFAQEDPTTAVDKEAAEAARRSREAMAAAPLHPDATPATSGTRRPTDPAPNVADSGTNGDVIMSSPPPYNVTGVLLQPKPSWPYIVARTGTADANSGFTVYNPNTTELFRVNGAGNVGIGTAGPNAKLHVFGSELFLQNMPPDASSPSVTFLTLANRAASGAAYLWRLATASSNGGAGVVPNGLDLYEYPNNANYYCCNLRLSIRPMSTASPKLFVIDGAGNVGIGMWSPTATLHVNGNGRIDGNLVVSGDITGAKVINATYQDVAEWVDSEEQLTAGSVVIIDPEKTNHVIASTQAYDTAVAGVVSTQPGVLLGVPGDSRYKIATTGRVRVRVDATRGPIRAGDLLVSSGVAGTAMKSVPVDVGGVKMHRPGTLIGKALEPLESGAGEILVLLSLQ